MKLKFRMICIMATVIFVTVSVFAVEFIRNHIITVDYQSIKTINELENHIKDDFYYSIDNQELTDSLLNGYISGLGDDYATYYPATDAQSHTDKLNGDAYGLGILTINHPETDEIYVWRVYDNSPADNAGIISGDIIIAINNQNVSDMGYTEGIKLLGNKNEVEVTIKRKNKVLSLDIKPAVCDVQSVYTDLIADKFGYIQIIDFNKKTYAQFKAAIDSFKECDAGAVIIDLRHNSGGTVDTAAKMLDYILPKGDIIRVKDNKGNIIVRNKSNKNALNKPMVLLVDDKTASAAEIFASAIRDFDAGVLIGNKTFGKGAIQRSYDLSNGGTAKFTIAEFVDKNGNSYHKKGIEPDINISEEPLSDYEYYFLSIEDDKALSEALKYLNHPS